MTAVLCQQLLSMGIAECPVCMASVHLATQCDIPVSAVVLLPSSQVKVLTLENLLWRYVCTVIHAMAA